MVQFVNKWLGTVEVPLPAKGHIEAGVLHLTQKSCQFLADQMRLVLNKTQVMTSFEPNPEGRNLFDDILTRFNGNAIVVVIGVPYPLTKPIALKKGMGFIDGVAAYGEYHNHVKVILKQLADAMTEELSFTPVSAEQYVDTSPYVDRELGFWCGLGAYGRNHQLMNATLGSHFNIGTLLLGAPEGYLSEEKAEITMASVMARSGESRLFEGCRGCNACVTACPTGICGSEMMARDQCLSYITQTKEAISDAMALKMGTRLYGCSTCQLACPYNEPMTDLGAGQVALKQAIGLTNRSFKRQYGHTGIAWRGVNVFKRNAMIAMRNTGILLSDSERSLLLGNPFLKSYVGKLHDDL
jgi:epoxyqueuosine reductase